MQRQKQVLSKAERPFKTLKRIYINWAKKQKYHFITGHVENGISKRFPGTTETVKVFPDWYGLKTPFEYYRRTLI